MIIRLLDLHMGGHDISFMFNKLIFIINIVLMEEKNILTYLTNNHLTKKQLVEKYNEKIKQKSDLENKYNIIVLKYNGLATEYNDIIVEYTEMNNKLIELNSRLEEKYDNTVIGVKENICELLDVIDDIKHDISNNNYIKSMGFLKNINDKLQKEDNQ